MIQASAIKFHINATNSDVILCGLRHSDIFEQLMYLGFKPNDGYKVITQGFITDKGEFLNRVEAFIHARKCRQITFATLQSRTLRDGDAELFSEDLW